MLAAGDEVWAWNNNDIKRTKGLYIAKHRTLNHGVRTREGLKYFDNVVSVKVVNGQV